MTLEVAERGRVVRALLGDVVIAEGLNLISVESYSEASNPLREYPGWPPEHHLILHFIGEYRVKKVIDG